MNKKHCLRFCFYVSGKASRLVKLLDACDPLLEQIAVVVHDGLEDNDLLAGLLLNAGIAYEHVQLEKLVGKKAGETISAALLAAFTVHSVDYCFCFGSRILGGELLHTYRMRIINFHPSILPLFPGVNAVDQALSANAYLLGNTAHFIDEGIDTGPIIMQSAMPAANYRGYDSVLDLQLPMLRQIAKWLCEGRILVDGDRVRVSQAQMEAQFFPKLDAVSQD